MKEQLSQAMIEQLANEASGQVELDQAMEILIESGAADTTKCCATGTCR